MVSHVSCWRLQGMHAVAASRLHTHPAGGSAPPPPAIGSVPLLPLHPQQQVQPNKGPLLQQQHKEPSQQQQQAEGPPRGSLIPTRQALVHTAIAPAAAAPAAASHLQLAPASRTQAGQQGVAAPCSTAAAAASGAPAGAAAVGAVVTAAAAAGMVQDAAGDADGWCRLTQRPFDAQIGKQAYRGCFFTSCNVSAQP